MQFSGITRNIRYCAVWLLFAAIFFSTIKADAQFFNLTGSRKRASMSFRMVRNMVIVSLHINDRGPFNFILDTGVGIMLITEPKLVDSIAISTKRTIKIYGLNGENYEAYVTPVLKVEMPNMISVGVSAAILKEDHFGLSNYAGMPIHGLLGYEFFNNLTVKFNFADSTLTVSKPQYVKALRKGIKIPLSVEDHKPYINTNIKLPDGKTMNAKLLVDLGAGHPLSLETLLSKEGSLPQKFIAANLGLGLTGPVSGYISRVNEVDLGKYKLKDVLTSFPDVDYLKKEVPLVPRDGSIGFGILKRFTMILDYANGAMYLKHLPGRNDPFEHDMSGMEYYFTGDNYAHLIVSRVEPGSPADNIGIEKGDEITAINFKPVYKFKTEEIDEMFRSRDGRSLLLDVYRYNIYNKFIITLKKRI